MALCIALGPSPGAAPAAVGNTLPAPAAQISRLTIDGARSDIGFDADGTFGVFRGRAGEFAGWAELPDTVTFRGARGRVEIEAASLATGNGTRDGHLRDELEVDRYPQIDFLVEDVMPAEPAAVDSVLAPMATLADTVPAYRVIIQGTLTVRDVKLNVRVPAWVRYGNGELHVRGRLPTRFTELGMKPPSRMLGVLRVDDDLVLRFDAVFGASTP